MAKIILENMKSILDDIDIKSVFDFSAPLKDTMPVYVYLVMTDLIKMIDVKEFKNDTDVQKSDLFDKLLEIRMFSKDCEVRFKRTSLGTDWYKRVCKDDQNQDYYEENYYLDIDTTVERVGGKVQATGGGSYELPASIKNINNLQLTIRNYVGYYINSGQAYVRDWRLVGFKEVR